MAIHWNERESRKWNSQNASETALGLGTMGRKMDTDEMKTKQKSKNKGIGSFLKKYAHDYAGTKTKTYCE